MELRAERVLERPPGALADLLTDLRRRPAWAAGSVSVELPEGATGAVGETYAEQLAQDSITIELAGRVEALGPERFAWAGASEQVEFRRVVALAPEGAGTRVVASYEIEFKSLALALMEKRIRPALEAMLAADLDGLERTA